jgi:hypothetical protein
LLKKEKIFQKFFLFFPQAVEIVENLGDVVCCLWKTRNPRPVALLDKRPK